MALVLTILEADAFSIRITNIVYHLCPIIYLITAHIAKYGWFCAINPHRYYTGVRARWHLGQTA
jgi:hypothetical protein